MEKEGDYVDGELEGLWTRWYESGVVMSEATFAHGRLEGPYFEYSPGGQLLVEGTYAGGLRHGVWRMFSEDGKLDPKTSGVYAADARTGDLPAEEEK